MHRRWRGFCVALSFGLWRVAFSHTLGEWNAHMLRLHEMAVAINQVRVAHGLPPLKLNPDLCRAAQLMSDEILLTGNFGHIDSEGRRADARARMFGYEFEWLGENLAAGQSSAERALQAWLNSLSHRENLLNPAYREMGLGYTQLMGSRYGSCWAQLLGSRVGVYPLVINLDAPLHRYPRSGTLCAWRRICPCDAPLERWPPLERLAFTCHSASLATAQRTGLAHCLCAAADRLW
jgi:hypothetical protein